MSKKYTEKNGRIYAREDNKYAGSIAKPASPSSPNYSNTPSEDLPQKLDVNYNSDKVQQTYHEMHDIFTAKTGTASEESLTVEVTRRRVRMRAAAQRVAYLDALAITYLGDQPRWISALRSRFGYETGSDTSDWEETIRLMGESDSDLTEEEVDRVSKEEQEKAAEELAAKVQELLDQLKQSEGDNYVARPGWLRHAEALIRITRGSTAKEELQHLRDFPEDIKLT